MTTDRSHRNPHGDTTMTSRERYAAKLKAMKAIDDENAVQAAAIRAGLLEPRAPTWAELIARLP